MLFRTYCIAVTYTLAGKQWSTLKRSYRRDILKLIYGEYLDVCTYMLMCVCVCVCVCGVRVRVRERVRVRVRVYAKK